MSDFKLGSETYTFDELEKKYRNFIAPGFKLLIDYKDAVKQGMAISELTVETSVLEDADSVTFTVANAYDPVKRDFAWLGDLLTLGKPLEVHLGYTDKMTPMFFGYITAINISFPGGGMPQLTVSAMDLSFKMMRGRRSDEYANKKISEIVEEIGRKHGATSFVIDPTPEKIPVLATKPESDYQFLQNMAKSLNYEFFVVGKTLYFRKKFKSKTPMMTLSMGKHLMRCSFEQNLSEQVTGVRVKAWDQKNQKVIETQSSKVNVIGSNSKTGADLLKSLGTFEEHLYLNVDDVQEAQTMAEAAMNEKAIQLVSGEAACIGLPEIRAGRCIKLDGLGKRLDQVYYISKAKHTIGESGYTTEFSLQGNAV